MYSRILSLLLIATPIALAQQGVLDGTPTCSGDAKVPSDKCVDACGKLSGHTVKNGDKYSNGGCNVQVDSISVGDTTGTSDENKIRGRIASDACGQLINKCPGKTTVWSNFKGTNLQKSNSEDKGRIYISYDDSVIQH